MGLEEYYDYIQNTRLFSGINHEELSRMLRCLGAKVEHFKKNDFIYRMGDTISTFGMVLTGNVLVIREDFWGNRTIISQLGPGELFGESYSFAKNEPLLTSMIAAESAMILFMNIGTFTKMCKNTCSFHRNLIENMLGEVSEKNLELTRKIQHTSQRNTRDKLLSYLSEQAQRNNSSSFSIPFNRQELADYLSVDRSAMSLELSKMRRDGLIEYEKNSFILLNPIEQ